MRFTIPLILLLLVVFLACQKPVPIHPAPSQPVGIQAPEEPLLNLAWRAATQIQAAMRQLGVPMELRTLPLENSAGIPGAAADSFQAALETRLQTFGIQMPGDATLQLDGSLYWLRDQLFYGMKLRKGEQVLFTDTTSIPRDANLEKTFAQFAPRSEMHDHIHKEAAIPTPVARLDEAPLDVGQHCPKGRDACDIVLLYADRIEVLNWKTLAVIIKKIPSEFISATRSRAPSGKILHDDGGYALLSNSLIGLLHYDQDLNGPVAGVQAPALPAADPGFNQYSLGDGRFSDFEMLPQGGMAVVETNHHLSLAQAGSLITAANPAGAAMAVQWPQAYTSAPVLPDQPDSVQKYTYQDGNLKFESSRPTVGSIVDLSITDLNRDGTPELLVTVQKPEGVFIEVWEAF